jgi:hypothetical protein
MRNHITISLAVLLLVGTGVGFGGVVYDKDWADWDVDLSKPFVVGDLLENATWELEQGGFIGGLGDPGDLNDGIWGGSNWANGSAVLRDYAADPEENSGTPAATIRYDFPAPVDISEIRVFASNPDQNAPYNGRSYHNYQLEYKLAGDPMVYELLDGEYIRSSNYGDWNGSTIFLNKTGTYIYDDAGGLMLEGVEYLRFKFYDVSQTTGGFWDPFWPSDPLDTDGERAAFEGSGLQEIDVIPEPASVMLLLAGVALLRRR